MKKTFSSTRRTLLRGSLFGAGAVVLSGLLPATKVHATDLPKVDEDDPTAKSLKYVHDATKSERPDDSQFCNNCQYFKGDAGSEWARCDIFPGKQVAGPGWCNVWTKKA
jgi:hypothetical protein